MKIVQHGRKRKAISPVLATVILIAITLIAAIAVAGFVFGLFGTFTSSANLQSQVVSCSAKAVTGTVAECEVALTNTGGSTASVTGCSIYGTAGYSGPATKPVANTPVGIPAGTTTPINVFCDSLVAGTVGAVVSGSLTVASGAPLAFTATYVA